MSGISVDRELLQALFLAARYSTQVSVQFILGMVSRMAMSFEKYGDVHEAYPHKVDAMKSADLRIAKYQESGNAEHLIDAANFLMIEFMCPRNPQAHFKAEDSASSPGRVWNTGEITQQSNTESREEKRMGFYKREGD